MSEGDLMGFLTTFLLEKYRKIEGEPLVSSGIVSYTEKRNNFYSSVP